ncbi:MAG TPA: glycosyltransferase family 39 protein [Candidatus Brocadiaceae bacterium]|nr:glycosyltransferase family 39 protein [Candidatus Brocadiaceae bacterium]
MIGNFRERRTRFFDLLLLTALSAMVIFPALGQNREWASHEIRHAEIIREMVENGDYLIPRLMGGVYHDKPPVMHAIAAVLTRMVGKPSMMIARIPSAAAGILGVLAVYGIGLLLLDRRSALIAAIALLGMPGYSIVARHARPDMILCASVLCSCLCIGLGMRERRYTWQTFYLIFGGLCAGLGVITKGPYGILVPAFFAIFAPFRQEDLKRPRFNWASFVLGFLTALAIWAVPAYLRDGGHYIRGVIFQPDLDVSMGGSGKSVFYYVLYGIMLTFPYSLFLPLAIRDLRRCGYSAPLAIAGAIFIVISCIPKKRQHYLVPFYPFFALGIAESLVRYYETSRLVRRAAQILVPLSIIAVPLYFVAVQPFVQPYKNSQMFFAKEILRVIEPKSQIYCLSSEEALAWVGQRYEGIKTLSGDNPSLVSQTLRNAGAGSYLVIGERDYTSLLKHHEAIPGELVLSHKASHHEKMMLFRLGKRTSETP